MSTFFSETQHSDKNPEHPGLTLEIFQQRRALWAASLSFLLEGFILAFAIYQLALVNFLAQNIFAYILIVAVFLAFVTVVISMILILRERISLGVNLVYYSGYIPVITVTSLFAGRGYIAFPSIGIISLSIIYFVFPQSKRRIPIITLVATIVYAIIVELINPAYRQVLPANTSLGPVAGIVFAIIFSGIIIRQERSHFKLRAKSLFAVGFVLSALILTLTLGAINNVRHQVEEDEINHLTTLYNNYNHYVTTLADRSASLVVSIADRKDVVDLYKAKDRQGLLELLTPLFNTLKTNYEIVHLYIENPDGTVFVRVHNPASYGDDVTYRRTAAAALDSHQTVAGVEIGPSRLGIRGVTPLFDGDEFIGMVEVGIDYDEQFIKDMEDATNAQYSMWVTKEAAAPAGLTAPKNAPASPLPGLFFYASTYQGTFDIPAEIYQQVLESGEPAPLQYVTDGESEFAVLVAPMIGYGNRTIGIFEIITNREQRLAAIRADTRNLISIAVLAALTSLSLMWFLSQRIIIHPIEKLTVISQRLIRGELNARVQISGSDEFSQLGHTLNLLSENTQKLISELEERVAERTTELELTNKQIERRAEQFEAIAQIARTISTVQNLDELLPRVTRMISQRFGFYHVGIFLLDENGEFAILRAANSPGGKQMLARKHRLEVGHTGIVGYVTSTGNSRIALDTGTDAVYFDNPDLPDTRSEMALPLTAGNTIIGALDVQSTAPNAFTQEDINIMLALTGQVSSAIQNTRLYEESRNALENAEQAYRQVTGQTWSNIKRISPLVGYRFDGTKPEPLNRHASGDQAEVQENVFSVPVQLRNTMIGNLKIKAPSNDYEWTEDEITIIQATAERVALAIENARLLIESQKQAAKEQVIGEISAKIGASINLDNILQTTIREMGRILPGAEISIHVENE